MTGRLISLRTLVLPFACACFCIGCSPAPPQKVQVRSERPAEPAWAQQIEQVASGKASTLRFVSRPVTPDQWRMLQQQCESLKMLDVDASQLASDDWQVLAALPELRRLQLTGPVDDEALRQIASASELTILNLPEGVFTDEGLQHLESLSKLELLRFGSPNVTDAGLAVIPRLGALRFLHLINVPVTDAGLKHLHETNRLESFYLDGGRCTDEGLYALLKALPQLHFHRDQLHLPDDPRTHPHEDASGSQ